MKWNQETARQGGLVKTKKKAKAVRLNGLKHGRRSNNPEVLKLITPNALEKLAGITKEDKIKQIQNMRKFYGAKKAVVQIEAIESVVKVMHDLTIKCLIAQKEKDETRLKKELESLARLQLAVFDRKFGNPKTSVQIENVDKKIVVQWVKPKFMIDADAVKEDVVDNKVVEHKIIDIEIVEDNEAKENE
ncbi:MAG: hypothetical protein KAX49_14415 [Halanaerobiales bacterium]|nr:hypothetical protein [Halanaerobiales bacterium]